MSKCVLLTKFSEAKILYFTLLNVVIVIQINICAFHVFICISVLLHSRFMLFYFLHHLTFWPPTLFVLQLQWVLCVLTFFLLCSYSQLFSSNSIFFFSNFKIFLLQNSADCFFSYKSSCFSTSIWSVFFCFSLCYSFCFCFCFICVFICLSFRNICGFL